MSLLEDLAPIILGQLLAFAKVDQRPAFIEVSPDLFSVVGPSLVSLFGVPIRMTEDLGIVLRVVA